MALKTNELIILSYINKYKKIDYIEIQKAINDTYVQISNVIYDLYDRGYFTISENTEYIDVTDKAKREPIHIWKEWLEDEKLEFDGCQIYIGAKNEYGVPLIKNEQALVDILKLENVKDNAYNEFFIYGKQKERHIVAPSRKLKERQRWILKNILSCVEIKDCVHGFVKGKSIVTNAKCHVAKKEILCLDISDFFPSTKLSKVIDVFKKLGYIDAVAEYLATLCTYNGELPQGAPTSPALSNIIFTTIDEQLMLFAKENDLTYTRYADDLTFSTNSNNIEEFIDEIECIINEFGYTLNKNKTHIMKDNYRKMVTGLVVNETVKVPKKFKKFFE